MPEPLKTLALNLSLTQEEMQKAINEAGKGRKNENRAYNKCVARP